MNALQSTIYDGAVALESLRGQLGDDARLLAAAEAMAALTAALLATGKDRDELLEALWEATGRRLVG